MLAIELKERLAMVPDNATVYISYNIEGNYEVIDASTIRSCNDLKSPYICIES